MQWLHWDGLSAAATDLVSPDGGVHAGHWPRAAGDGLFARRGTDTQFAHFMVDGQMIRTVRLIENLVSYYKAEGSWATLHTEFDAVLLPPLMAPWGR
ncbi:MAG: hypothetical protein R2867_28160 [Caldilineaceae bacterium]